MPVTFKSTSGASIMMLDAVGKEMLKMMDFGSRIPGAISAEDLPQARENLKKALSALQEADETDSEEEEPPVSLHTRALPLLNLIDVTIADDQYLRWE